MESKYMFKTLYFFLTFFISTNFLLGQQSITLTGTATTQNFNGISNSATATLPTGFRMGTDWSTGVTATTQAAGTSGTGVLNGSSTGGFYNFANGITSSSGDRAIGFLTSGSYASPRSIIYAFTNNTGVTVSSLSISWNYEKYRSGQSSLNYTFFHGSTSTASTANTSGDQSYISDANNTTISNPPLSSSKSLTLTGLSITNGSTYYIRWTYTGSASSNAQGVGIDDFSITLTAPTTSTITGGATTSAFTTTYGTNSSVQSFSVSGSNLTADLLATAPTGFDVSSDGITFGSIATFTTSAGSASGTLRIRLKATANAGNYNSANIVLSSTGAVSVNITTPASGNTVSTKSLTITGLTFNNKVYDGTNTISVTGTPTYVGLVNGESFSVGGSVSWVFSSVNVGTNITLTRTGSFTTPTSNYTVTQPTPTANITKATQTITFENFPFKCSYDIDFSPNATSNSGLTLTYTSSDPNVATIVANKVHVVGNGITTITASQSGNGNYFAATDVSKDLVVKMSISTWTFESLNFSNTGTTPTFGGGSTEANLGDYTSTSNITGFHSSNLTTWMSQNPGSIGNGSTKSLSASNWSVGDYFQFKVSTLGYDSILLTFEQTSSNTGPREFKLQYSFDGTSYTDVSDYTVPYFVTSGTPYAWSTANHQTQSSVSFDFKNDVNFRDKTQIFFRLVMRTTTSINGGVVGTTGTSRIDNINIMGDYYTVPLDLEAWIKNNPKPQVSPTTVINVDDCDEPPTYYDFSGKEIKKLEIGRIYLEKKCGSYKRIIISE